MLKDEIVKTEKPKISIIIPSYNSGNYLPYTLESIDRQEYRNYEVIIVDGRSNDNTVDVVRKYDYIISKFISEIDKGQSEAVNKGVSYATGDFVLWQNADDVFFPRAFSSFADFFSRKNSYDVYFGDIAFLGKDGRELWRRYFTDFDRLMANYHGLICYNQAAFIRRDVIDDLGFLDEDLHYAMDREFFLRLYRNGVKFKHFDHVVAGFRHQPESKTETLENAEKWAQEHIEIARKFNLILPKSYIGIFLERLASIDKALRMFAANPNRFAATVKRKILDPDYRPY